MAQHEKLAGALQENILALLVSSDDHCQLVKSSIGLNLYSNAIFRTIASKAYDFIDAHRVAPRDHLPDLLEEYTNDTREGKLYAEMLHSLRFLGETLNVTYVLNSLTAFVEEHTLRLGIIEAADALQQEDVAGARAHIEAALHRTAPMFDPGITLLGTLAKLRRGELLRDVMPTGVSELDRYDLGPARQELWMIVGGPKRGKTSALISVTRAALLDRRKVLYLTLEYRDELIARKMVQSIIGVTAKQAKDPIYIPQIKVIDNDNKDDTFTVTNKLIERGYLEPTAADREAGKIPYGLQLAQKRIEKLRLNDRLLNKSFPTGSVTVRDLVSYLDQLERLHNFVPDLLVLDYADLMKIETENYRISIGAVLKDLRGRVAVERNMAVATASQLNRPGSGSTRATEMHVAEDFSKIAISDTVIIINQIMDEKAAGLARLYVAAARNDRDKFSVLITQNLNIGQFAIMSVAEPAAYHSWLKKLTTTALAAKDEDTPVEKPDEK